MSAKTNNQPPRYLFIFLIIFAVVSLLIAGFMVLLNQKLVAQISDLGNQQLTSVKPVKLTGSNSTSGSQVDISGWKTYKITPDQSLGFENYNLSLPASWKQIEHSSNFQDTETFQDTIPNATNYVLIIKQMSNLNSDTKKPYTNLREATGLSYDVTQMKVDGQIAARVLPRAGSESDFKVLFFAKDAKILFSIELNTPRDGSKVKDGEILFNQILLSFKFNQQSQVEIPSLKTFINTKYNYKFQYSTAWEVGSYNNEDPGIAKSITIRPVNDPIPAAESGYVIVAMPNPENLSLSDWVKQNPDNGILLYNHHNQIIKSTMIRNGVHWEKIENNSIGYVPSGFVDYGTVFQSNLYYVVSYGNDLTEIDQILSTFKFTK
jgi:hypothetical protein